MRHVKENTLDALGNGTRRDIIRLLRDTPLSVVEISENIPVSRPAISKHLKLLKSAELVQVETQGTRNLYSLNPVGFAEAKSMLDSFWDEGLSRFKLLAENTTKDKK